MSTLDLFADEQPTGAESIGPQSVVLRGHALPPCRAVAGGGRRHCGAGAAAPSGHAGRIHHVGGHDQLRRAWAGPATGAGYRYSAIDPTQRPALARHAGRVCPAGGRGGRCGGVRWLCARCLPHQPVPARHPAFPAPRTATSATWARPLSRCPWACRPLFCLEDWRGRTARPGCRCSMATWWSGAVWIGCATTAYCRSRTSLTRCWRAAHQSHFSQGGLNGWTV